MLVEKTCKYIIERGYEMKKVLCICYFFPPLGMSQRSVKFVKYLSLYGWQPIVLAPQSSNYHRKDPAMLNEIPKNCQIIRVPSSEDLPKIPLVRNEDFQTGWYPEALKLGLETMEKEKINMIYSTASPYLSHLVAMKIKEMTGTPWVADFRDEWTTNPYIVNKYSHEVIRINQKFEKQVLTNADGVISVSEQITNILYELSGLESKEKFFTIMNGYDPMDFRHLNFNKRKRNKKLTICYMGSLYGMRRALAQQFFQILDQSLAKKILKQDEIELLMVGDPLCQIGLHVKEITRNTGYVNHLSALNEAAAADLFLLFISPKEGEQTVTSKIFELINLNKPILAIVPPNGVAANIIRNTRTGIVIDSQYPETAIPYIQYFLKQWKLGNLNISPNQYEIEKYNRKEQTKMLASIMDTILLNDSNSE
jgi:hypothetical protein